MFTFNENLADCDLSNWDVARVTSMYVRVTLCCFQQQTTEHLPGAQSTLAAAVHLEMFVTEYVKLHIQIQFRPLAVGCVPYEDYARTCRQ